MGFSVTCRGNKVWQLLDLVHKFSEKLLFLVWVTITYNADHILFIWGNYFRYFFSLSLSLSLSHSLFFVLICSSGLNNQANNSVNRVLLTSGLRSIVSYRIEVKWSGGKGIFWSSLMSSSSSSSQHKSSCSLFGGGNNSFLTMMVCVCVCVFFFVSFNDLQSN